MEASKLITSLNKSGIGAYSDLFKGDSSINLSLAEFTQKRLIDLPFTFKEMISYLWNDGSIYSVDNTAILNDPCTLFVGPPLSHPFKDLKDLKWKLSNSKENGIIDTTYVSNPLFIYENDIKFYNIFDSSSRFVLGNTKTTIYLEEAFIRDASNNEWDSNTYQYKIISNIDPSFAGYFVLESSLGVKSNHNGYVLLFPNPSTGIMQYAFNDLFNVPLLTFNNFKCTDSSNVTRDLSTNYILDIRNGRIGMSDPCNNVTEYIKFTYDTSLSEQSISYDIVYESNRLNICTIDPSIYYSQSVPDASVIVIDNSIHTMKVNHIGDYNVEVYGWDSFNNNYYTQSTLFHKVQVKTPTIYTITNYTQSNTIDSSTISNTELGYHVIANNKPIYDRLYPMYGLERVHAGYGQYYLNLPSVSYFQNLPNEDSINRIYNLTERVMAKSGNNLIVDINYQKFYNGDSVNIVKYDKGMYDYVDSMDASITAISGNMITVNGSISNFIPDASNDIYLMNTTLRSISDVNGAPDFGTYTLTINNYAFLPSQMINLIVNDTSTGYSWGASYKVYDVSGNIHSIDNDIPSIFINNPRYTIHAKHAFTTFSTTDLVTTSSRESNGEFNIYTNDQYNEEWFLDNTFALINMEFDQTQVNLDWATSFVYGNPYKIYHDPIIADTSSFILLIAEFDPSTYMLNQKNIWTVRYNESKDILFRVHNKEVPYRFSEKGYYDVQVESYDSYGNISINNYEGLIKIV